ncbi:MAG: methylated-DNA--[protein]-cysteine S-methyltransferase [Bdellovibrionales bacterium]
MGTIRLTASDNALLSLSWGKENIRRAPVDVYEEVASHPILMRAEKQLDEYFAGKRKIFDVPLAPEGTEFQKRVWAQLLKIPYGECISYGEQARRLGQPKSARAVGSANGKNPIGILIPCHRVVGTTGNLTGFAGGIEIKRYLLQLEGHQLTFAGLSGDDDKNVGVFNAHARRFVVSIKKE